MIVLKWLTSEFLSVYSARLGSAAPRQKLNSGRHSVVVSHFTPLPFGWVSPQKNKLETKAIRGVDKEQKNPRMQVPPSAEESGTCCNRDGVDVLAIQATILRHARPRSNPQVKVQLVFSEHKSHDTAKVALGFFIRVSMRCFCHKCDMQIYVRLGFTLPLSNTSPSSSTASTSLPSPHPSPPRPPHPAAPRP